MTGRNIVGGTGAMQKKPPYEFWNDEFFPWFRDHAYPTAESAGNAFYMVRRNHVLDIVKGLRPGRALDVGCGSGELLGDLQTMGWSVSGIDLSPNMVGLARSRLAQCGMAGIDIRLGDAAALPESEVKFDLILCLGPVEFLTPAQAAAFYQGAGERLADGGSLIVAHANALFDLFSIDGYTAEFLADLCQATGAIAPEHAALLRSALHGVLDAAEMPVTPLRERVEVRADNPLEMPAALQAFGYKLVDTIFYRFYAVPPRIARAVPALSVSAVKAESELARNWRGVFLASGFVTHSIYRH